MLQPDRIAYCFSLTHELPNVEFKGPGYGREKPLFGRIVRAAMALTNRSGGGTLIIGVAEVLVENSKKFIFNGLTPEQLATWNYDDTASGFNSYTSSPIEFDRQVYEHNGCTFLIIDIHEFASVPVMCVKDYPDPANPAKFILRKGAFYVRTLNKPESAEMLTSEEVRMLFGLANSKAVQSFVTLTKLAGINIAPLPEDKELFAKQLQGWSDPILKEIRSRGYWDIRIRPETFQEGRLPLAELRQLLIRASLNYRGWEFPYVTPRPPEIGIDWIGLEHQKEYGLQAWRFFQSGQFTAAVGLLEDWHDKLTYQFQATPNPGEVLTVGDVVFRLTEIFGLASRLAITDVYRDEPHIVIDLALHNVQGRDLYHQNATLAPMFVFSQPTKAGEIPYSMTLPKEEVIANPQGLARKAAQYIFARFGWNPSDELLATMQSEFRIHA